jgi:hypothetical protein
MKLNSERKAVKWRPGRQQMMFDAFDRVKSILIPRPSQLNPILWIWMKTVCLLM